VGHWADMGSMLAQLGLTFVQTGSNDVKGMCPMQRTFSVSEKNLRLQQKKNGTEAGKTEGVVECGMENWKRDQSVKTQL